MADKKTISEEISQLRGLEVLTQAYEEIASTRMKKTRAKVLSKRDFLVDIGEVFDQVRASYAQQVSKLIKEKKQKGERLTFLSHNGKTVAVLLSANTGLYGDIVQKTFNMFLNEVRAGGSEVTIVGRHGLGLFLSEQPNHPYTYFDLPDTGPKTKEVSDIIRHIVQYEKIHVYYGKFVNVVNQSPTVFSISAEIELDQDDTKPMKSFIFEPTLEKILMFFETEIFASLFEQSVNEGELAKYASRVMAMENAAQNIREYLIKLNLERLKITHRISNRKQLNSLSSAIMRVGGSNGTR